MTRKRRARTKDNVLDGKEVRIVRAAIETDRERLCIDGILFTGFRRGELVHMTEDWVRRGKIQVPSEMPCDCWECKKTLYRTVKRNGKRVKEVKKPSGVWMPKTEAGARGIPLNVLSRELFDWYFKNHHAVRKLVPCTRSVYYTIHDVLYPRIKNQLTHELIPHGLRGTFASRLAEQKVGSMKLKEIMGWDSVDVANSYVAMYAPSKEAEGLTIESFVDV